MLNDDFIFNLILVMVAIFLLIIYCIYVIIDENKKYKKIQFYKSKIKYDMDYDKYFSLVKNMKKVIFKKQMQLLCLKILYFIKGGLIWQKK